MTRQELIATLADYVNTEYSDDMEFLGPVDEHFNLGFVLDSFNFVSLQHKLETLLGRKLDPKDANKQSFQSLGAIATLAERYGL